MGRIARRDKARLLYRPSDRKTNDISVKSLRINAYKLRTSLSGVTIIYNQSNPELTPVYGQEKLRMQLYISWQSLRELRMLIDRQHESDSYTKGACIAWLQKYLRSASNLDALLIEIRKHKWPYVLSATTLF